MIKKLNITKALSEFIAVSTIAINISNAGTIIGGNIYLGIANNQNQNQTQQTSMSSVTISNSYIPCNSTWTLSQSFVVSYSNIYSYTYYYYSCTAEVYPQYYTLPTNIHEVSITVIPFDSSTGIVANFSGSVLAGQTLTLYVAPLYKGMYNAMYNAIYNYSNSKFQLDSNGYILEPPYMEYGETTYGFYGLQPYTENYPVNLNYNYFMPFFQHKSALTINAPSSTSTWEYYDFTSYNSNIQGITIELPNGNILIGSDANGNYYVSNLASSSTMFSDGGTSIMILKPIAEYIGTPDYQDFLVPPIPQIPENVPILSPTDIPLPPFWQASCITPYTNGYCYAKVPYKFEYNFNTKVIINYY